MHRVNEFIGDVGYWCVHLWQFTLGCWSAQLPWTMLVLVLLTHQPPHHAQQQLRPLECSSQNVWQTVHDTALTVWCAMPSDAAGKMKRIEIDQKVPGQKDMFAGRWISRCTNFCYSFLTPKLPCKLGVNNDYRPKSKSTCRDLDIENQRQIRLMNLLSVHGIPI